MFDKRIKPTLYKRQPGEYNLSLPISADWADKPQRVMLVIETIDSQDLKESCLLFDRSKAVVTNLMKYTIGQARKTFDFDRRAAAYCAVNFNNQKFMDKPKETWGGYRQQFTERLKKIVKELEPTHIIVFGDRAAHALLPDVEHIDKKRGWVFDAKIGGVKVKVCSTLDLQPLYTPKKAEETSSDEDEDDDDGDNADVYGKANLLFYVSMNVLNGLAGRNLYDLSHVKPKPVLVDTMEKFRKLYKKLKTAEVVAVDTEGRNLSVNHNAIHTIQFAFDSTKGYVLPLNAPDTPFTDEERLLINKKMRKFFGARPGKLPLKYLIFQFSLFDLRALRVELKLPVIHHPVWEITAGEWMLDENRRYLRGAPFNTPQGGLAQIFMYYGNDHYKTAKFSKEDRANANLTKLNNEEFIEYAAMDVQSIFGIHEKQQERASHLSLGDKKFLPYYRRLVLKQMSHTVHVLSHMRQRGVALDKLYLAQLKSNTSPLLKLVNDLKTLMNESPEVQTANKRVLKNASGQVANKGLFNKVPFLFDWGNYEHKAKLFFDVLGLDAVSYTKKTKQKQINKTFINAYKREVPLVEQFGRYQKLTKLWSAYVKGFWNRIQESVDSKDDFRLRPEYGFYDVVTGRLNSSKPSLQQVPQRGKESKFIKRMFTAPPGTMHVKFDYSAHEVRVWSYVSGDMNLAGVFRIGQTLRKWIRVTKDPEKLKELFARIKKEGDIHIINVKRFLQQEVDKSHPLRDAIKSVVFGVLYGKGAGSLSKDIVGNNTNTCNDKIDTLRLERKECKDKKRLAVIDQEIAKLNKEKAGLAKKYTKDFAADLIKRLFGDFSNGAKWLDWTKQHARENYYTYAPNGMRRNLFSMLTGIASVLAAMERRAANSPIQGFASQIGITSARLVVLELYKVLRKFGYIDNSTALMPAEVLKAVHDALYSEVPYEIVLIYIHVLQWVATYGVSQYYKDEFGIEFPIEPEIEIEFGATEDACYKWDWSDFNLKECLLKTLEDQVKIGTLKEDPKKVLKKIFKAYDNSELKEYLETNYPILGVSQEEIRKGKVKDGSK